MRPEYAKYFQVIGMGKKRELCVLSKVLTMRDMIVSQQPIKHIPKWIPRQFLNVSSQVLLDRIAILLRDAQPEEPVFQGNQNAQHQPASGLSPHSTPADPMTAQGGNHFQARQPRNRGPPVGRRRHKGEVIRATKVSQVITTSTTTQFLLGAPTISGAEEETKTQTTTPIGSGKMCRGKCR